MLLYFEREQDICVYVVVSVHDIAATMMTLLLMLYLFDDWFAACLLLHAMYMSSDSDDDTDIMFCGFVLDNALLIFPHCILVALDVAKS